MDAIHGVWGQPFQHQIAANTPCWGITTFNAIHMVMIVEPPFQGWVFVMDEADQVAGAPAKQRYALLDPTSLPAPGAFINECLTLPGPNKRQTQGQVIPGDFFCSGHVNTRDGDILFAGGTIYNEPTNPVPFEGSQLVYTWDPAAFLTGPSKGWTQRDSLLVPRYYPTLIYTTEPGRGEDLYRVSGGANQAYPPLVPADNHYEMYRRDPALGVVGFDTNSANQRILYAGPDHGGICVGATSGTLYWYPREHHLSNGYVFMSGMARNNSRALHNRDVAATPWNYTIGQWAHPNPPSPLPPCGWYSHDGSAVLQAMDLNVSGSPKDRVMRIGGTYTFGPDEITNAIYPPVPTDEVLTCNANPTGGSSWVAQAPLTRPRRYCNAVQLPDGSILVVGGQRWVNGNLVMNPDSELLLPGGGRQPTPPMAPRDYHATAVLLPDGRVLVAGGNGRTFDYQIYSPPYLFQPGRPVITSAPTVLAYGGGPYSVTYETSGETEDYVEKVVLIRPGSVTHHFDFEQRVIALAQVTNPAPPFGTITFQTSAPFDKNHAPPGYYMLFVVTNTGIPSLATWVQVQ